MNIVNTATIVIRELLSTNKHNQHVQTIKVSIGTEGHGANLADF